MTTSIYSVSDTQSQVLVDGVPVVVIDKVGGISSGVKATAISGLTVTQAIQTPLPSVGTRLTWNHGQGVAPVFCHLELVCVTAEFGYSPGDIVVGQYTTGAYWAMHHINWDATVVSAASNSATNWVVLTKNALTANAPTLANWGWRFKARMV